MSYALLCDFLMDKVGNGEFYDTYDWDVCLRAFTQEQEVEVIAVLARDRRSGTARVEGDDRQRQSGPADPR